MVNSLARYIRIVEVRGSNPLSSITHPRRLKSFRGFLCTPAMGNSLVVKVHYTLGSRKC